MCSRLRGLFIAVAFLLWAGVGYATVINFGTLQHNLVSNYQGLTTTLPDQPGPGYGIRLIDNGEPNVNPIVGDNNNPPAAAIWSASALDVADGFSISFEFRMSGGWEDNAPDPGGGPAGGDGFAFVIQNNPNGSQLLGRGAGGLGYMYIPNGLAVEFDTYKNDGWYGDPDGNHVAVNVSAAVTVGSGPGYLVPHHDCYQGHLTTDGYTTDMPDYVGCTSNPELGGASVSRPLNDGDWQTAEIVYFNDLGVNYLSLYLNSEWEFTTPVDLKSLLNLPASGDAYLGFTAGDRNAFQNHDLFFPVPEPATLLLFSTGLAVLILRHRRMT